MKNDTTPKNNTTMVAKIRRALRELQRGQDALHGYDRDFRA